MASHVFPLGEASGSEKATAKPRLQLRIGSMAVRFINGKQNARLKELRRALTSPGSHSRAALEGPHLLEEALRGGLKIACVFAAQGEERLLEGLPLPPEVDVLLVPRPLLASVLTTETPQAIAALVEPPDWTWAHLFADHGRAAPIIVAAGLQDPGNLGTIVRSAEAFGAAGIVVLPGTVTPWNPKAVRASAGSILRVPVIAAEEQECFDELREAGFKIYATALREARAAGELDLTVPAALIIGNEGNGVPKALAARADGQITIPCPGPVESLNAAVAASVLLYEAARQRAASPGLHPVQRRAR